MESSPALFSSAAKSAFSWSRATIMSVKGCPPAHRGGKKFAESMLSFAIALRQRQAPRGEGGGPGAMMRDRNRIGYRYRSLLRVLALELAGGAGAGLSGGFRSDTLGGKPPK